MSGVGIRDGLKPSAKDAISDADKARVHVANSPSLPTNGEDPACRAPIPVAAVLEIIVPGAEVVESNVPLM
jgi:hypothetical protein